jgi:hypothetical protein
MTVVSLADVRKQKSESTLDRKRRQADNALSNTGCCIVPHGAPPRWYLSLNQKTLNIMELIGIDPNAFMEEHKEFILRVMEMVEEIYWSNVSGKTRSLYVAKKTAVIQSVNVSEGKVKFIADVMMHQWVNTMNNVVTDDNAKFGYSIRCDIKVSISGFKYNKPMQWYSKDGV